MTDKIEITELQKSIMRSWKYDRDAKTVYHIESWNAALDAAIKVAEINSAADIAKLKIE